MGDPRVVRFLQLLVNRGFVEEIPISINGLQKKLFRFGPLGALLRRNILKQWWDAVVLNQPNAFCTESPLLVPVDEQTSAGVQQLKGSNIRASLSSDISSSYLSALKLTNGHLPVTVASTGQCFQEASEISTNSPGNLLANGAYNTQLLLQHYSPPVSVAQVFDYWLRTRLRWWRQFSFNPSKFSSSTNTTKNGQKSEEKNGLASSAITYTFPWGTETVETLTNLGEGPLKESEAKSGISHLARFHQKSFHPHLIECQTSVEQCMAVFLTDAYREQDEKKKRSPRNPDDSAIMMLHLHPLLSPYQVALSVSGSRSQEVRVLAEHVAKELREAGISVLQPLANQNSMESQYRRNDELGVPFSVVLSDQTLDSGIISVRNRDTRLKQQQHVSSLQSILTKNIVAHKTT